MQSAGAPSCGPGDGDDRLTLFRMLGRLIAIALTGFAASHHGPIAYRATPPTKGSLYVDAQTDRYLLGGVGSTGPTR